MMNNTASGICPSAAGLSDGPLLNEDQAAALEKTFKVLANANRLRMLHALVIEQEMCVSDLANILGLNTTAVSNQLQRMADLGIVTARREGLKIIYKILDPCTISVMNHAWCLTQCAEFRRDKQPLVERTV